MNTVISIYKNFYRANLGKNLLFYLVYIGRIATLLIVPLISKNVLDSIVPAGDMGRLVMWTGLAVAAQVGVIFTQLGTSYMCRILTTKLKNTMKTRMLGTFLSRSSEEQNIQGTGYVLKRIEQDVELFAKFVNSDLVSLIYGVVVLIVTMVLIYHYNVLLLCTTLASLPMLFASMTVFNKKVVASTTAKNEAMAKSSTTLSECIQGQKEIREFSAVQAFVEKYSSRLQIEFDRTMYAMRQNFKPGIMGQMSPLVGKASLLGIGGYALMKGTLTFGEYFAYSILVQYTYQAVGYLFQGNIAYQQSKAVMKRMSEILSEQKGNYKDFPNQAESGMSCFETIESIEVKDLCFKYPAELDYILNRISTKFARGEIVAFVGPSGAGKTTLMGLLKREYNLQQGEILVNSIPIQEIDRDYFVSRTATVRQTPFIFSGTIRENILMGSIASEQDIEKVVEQTHLENFLDSTENGINRDMSENAGNISGGEKQRVVLARAFLRKPEILFLDEITTGMDMIARNKIHDSLLKMKEKCIIILVTHSAETVRIADRIILLDNGSVVGEGTHFELYNSSRLYKQLFQSMENPTSVLPSPQDNATGTYE
ncbi:MAG: ABC transporter ATP-binding protein [Candidatus Sabulitectum sp.]|nr:ABC transporter ATP-binding protein [Candidatus Sabulitectum sp.]